MIRFACSHCQAHLSTSVERMGRSGHCPRCHTKIRVPEEATGTIRIPITVTPTAKDRWWCRWFVIGGILAAIFLILSTLAPDPYPERSVILDYLHEHLYNPDICEVTTWQPARIVYRVGANRTDPAQRLALIGATVRCPNTPRSSFQYRHLFLLQGRRVLATMQLPNPNPQESAVVEYNRALENLGVTP